MNCLSLLYLLFHLSVRVKQRRKGSLLTKEYCSDLISSSGPSFGASVLLLVGSSKGLVMEEETQMELEEGSYLQMLSIGEEEGHLLCLPSSLSSPASDSYSSHMLCFGGNEEDGFPFHGHITQKSSDSSSMSSLSSSPTSTTISSSKLSKKKVESTCGDRRVASVTTSKKLKTNGSNGRGSTKVGKEKLGEQIMALHQLVSPFGKSDTASVLHEALGYIRFLHDQVQVLSSPYLQRLPSSAHLHFQEGIRGGGEARITSDLRSRGLCLVPVSCTEHVANSNGADLWSPALAKNNISSSSTNH